MKKIKFSEDQLVDNTRDHYSLYEAENELFDFYVDYPDQLPYVYYICNPENQLIYTFQSKDDALEMHLTDFQRSNIRKTFIRYVNIDRSENAELENDMHPVNLFNNRNNNIGYNPHFSGNVNVRRDYEPKKIDQEMFDKYNKSNTLCLHLNDRTTTMLRQIYEGKGWDVINDGYEVDHTTLHALIDSHERIVMLGHGTSWGLIGFIRDCCAEHLKGKNVFAIWCNADKYFEKYLPEMRGKFITKNAPSEAWECRAAGCGNISEELMLENITYWCKLCADVVDDCLDGQVDKSVEYIRKNYLEKYGNHPVTIFNADSAHKFGSDVPLPKYEFKGEKLQPKDFPYPGFDEEEFLKHPVAHI